MGNELLTLKFRYNDIPNEDGLGECKEEVITIGVFDSFEEACIKGNEILGIFESKFNLNPNYNRRERFSKNGGCFGYEKRLITNLAYLQTPFYFYFKITHLKYKDISKTIESITNTSKKYNKWKFLKKLEDEI